ncbi:MAG: 2-hydroxyacyl-CoA dehydratase [Campylobacteraceae bacterium]|nr:2-hydroxyacyl-CoA dehydratase [Campylobacteraceae bacterium]
MSLNGLNPQNQPQTLHIGIDVGSTTVKLVALDSNLKLLHSVYTRHHSEVRKCIIKCISDLKNCPFYSPLLNATITIAGSGGMDIAHLTDIPFVQEVIACAKAVETFIPQTDVSVELGGEDAKITFFTNGVEQRMNGTCAGGTGAFIDQMAALLKTDANGLNELAKNGKNIYPIAARCGVFAKTDVQPLLNEGVDKGDIALSIFQAVANQTISGLSCGRKIRGNVVFLGGPLNFLSELKKRFIDILELKQENIIEPNHSELFVALGAALFTDKTLTLQKIVNLFENLTSNSASSINTLRALFLDDKEKRDFEDRHNRADIKRVDLKEYQGDAFLGLDCGSTTTKAVLLSDNNELLYEFYGSNEGEPLKVVKNILNDIYAKLPLNAKIAFSCVTGYGEALTKEAYRIDTSEVETIAHYKAASFFMKNVDCIVDIGGQDMKYVRIKNGTIDTILLNEACSSGCGSFIETFAHSVNMQVDEFGKAALKSKSPCDLGSRCTVFMNSSVKQAQKEGLSVADISAGLSYAVIKNALIKVIKLKNPEDLGENVIVQGGTFYNDSVLRAFEIISKREVIRPKIAGLMGAFGAALIAKERCSGADATTLLQTKTLQDFTIKHTMLRCNACSNSCAMTLNRFADGRKFITGNRCEKGAGKTNSNISLPNLYDYKYKKLFSYIPNTNAKLGKIGIPRALNMYENYPLWFTFLTNIGFEVTLSDESSKAMLEKGFDTLPSDSLCYPAKLVHGHIVNLIEKGVEAIFYPCVAYEQKEFSDLHEHYNCPIVVSYPEQIRNNIDLIREKNINYIQPFLSLENKDKLISRLIDVFKPLGIPAALVKASLNIAWEEQLNFKKDLQKKGEETIEFLKNANIRGIVLSGRPYHLDPEIHHGIPQVITSLGMAVLTEDSISHIESLETPLRVVDQWTYHARLYRAANFATKCDFIDIIQLNSFGCGIDSVTTDQVQELLEQKNKIYTCIKIDEVNNLGAVKIRIRSLKAALAERKKSVDFSKMSFAAEPKYKKVVFTKQMKTDGYTIIAPQMSPIHFQFLESCFSACGHKLKLLEHVGEDAIDDGLKYVNNDACYPSIIVIGQIINELKSGKCDPNKTAAMMTQTGGGCRATNYIAYLRKALSDAGFPQVPVISFNMLGMEKHDGFHLSLPLLNRLMMSCVYGDVLMQTLFRTRPYEKVKGSANALFHEWSKRCKESLKEARFKTFNANIEGIIRDFDNLPLLDIKKPRVGLVGEILVKYHPTANNDIVDIIEREGCEAVMPGMMDFLLYCSYGYEFNYKYLSRSALAALTGMAAVKAMEFYRKEAKKLLKQSNRFTPPAKIDELAFGAEPILSRGNQTGEGWFLTAEMVHLIQHGVPNIVCMQPFACLPNHITGKGVIKALKERYPQANITAVDYDPGSSAVNQLNRIKLMLSVAFKNLEKENANKDEFSEITL